MGAVHDMFVTTLAASARSYAAPEAATNLVRTRRLHPHPRQDQHPGIAEVAKPRRIRPIY
jgi:hypothetical protein